jgi:transcription-repair coupling factor (superfamily II helicase)
VGYIADRITEAVLRVLYTILSRVKLHILKREIVRESDLRCHLSNRLFPLRLQYIEVQDIPARIPDQYIENETLKLQAYKKIAGIDSEDAANDVINELIDRYGDIPEMTHNLIKIAEIRSHAERVGVSSIKASGRTVTVSLHEKNRVDAYALVMTREEVGDRLTITGGGVPTLLLYPGNSRPQDELLKLMRALRRNVEAAEQQKQQEDDHAV